MIKMKYLIQILAENPLIFNTIRRIVEINYISTKQVIKKEFFLDHDTAGRTSAEKVLDLPCGTGEFCTLFSPESYHGMDISEKYIEYARKKFKRRFLYGDAKKSGFDSDYFDKILTLGFLHHLDDSSVNSVLKEVNRILKPDGTLLLIEDAPITNKFNILGRVILNNDIGSNIRSGAEYKAMFEKYFIVEKFYEIKSGLFNYSVFVLVPIS